MSASRSSFIRLLFFALVLALLASARAEGDHDDDEHGDHAHDEETPVEWACTAPCGAANDAHPCGDGEFVDSDELSTCALTQLHIMDVPDHATTDHHVPCPSDVCLATCDGKADKEVVGNFTCFETDVTTDDSKAVANHRALAMGCEGSHEMSGPTWMPGEAHGDCPAGSVHFHDDHSVSAASHPRATFAAVALVLAVALTAA